MKNTHDASVRDSTGCDSLTGYRHPLYAKSLSAFGDPFELAGCGGWLLERSIRSSDYRDAMGCYPLFCCSDWSRLESDLASLGDRLVSVALVVDPFAPVRQSDLMRSFHMVKPFKEHFVVDVTQPTEEHVNKHHLYYTRKAIEKIHVEVADDPAIYLDEWVGLYQTLVHRHLLSGMKAFSKESFSAQFRVPGLVMFRALRDQVAVGAHLWFVQSGVAYSHLAAFNEEGYAAGASYALYWAAIQTFKKRYAEHVRWIDLGAGAGIGSETGDGLSQFKSGWAGMVKTKYFCGRICNPEAYERLTGKAEHADNSYFPAYRSGEAG